MKKVLFAVNGFGMGNATRCDALADLLGADTQIDIITSDKALQYFQSGSRNGKVYPQKDINAGKPKKFGTPVFFLKYVPYFLMRIVLNFKTQRALVAQNKYDLVIFDSDYSFILHRIFRTKTVLVGLNNSYEVLNYFFQNKKQIRVSLLPSLFVESLDFLMHSVFCRFVICPSIKPEALKGIFGKFLIAPLLVRERLLSQPAPVKRFGIMVMVSSSQVESPVSALVNSDFTTDNIQQLLETRAVICNAGQSSISECFYLNKPALIVPIPKHAEQFANAQLAAEKGLQQSEILTTIDFKFSGKPQYNFSYPETAAIIKNHLSTIMETIL